MAVKDLCQTDAGIKADYKEEWINMKKLSVLIVFLMIFTIIGSSVAYAKPDEPAQGKLIAAKSDNGNNQNNAGARRFKDTKGHWAEELIDEMADRGIVVGVKDDEFAPDLNMTRSEFAVALHRLLKIEINYFVAPDITKVFNDVKNDDWFANQLIDLVTVNIIDDVGSFRPNDPITREEMIHYMVNAYNYKFGEAPEFDEDILNSYSDKGEIKENLRHDMKTGLGLGLIIGRGNNKLQPKGNSTRAEVLTVLKRLLDLLNKNKETNVAVDIDYKLDNSKFTMILRIVNNSDNTIVIDHSSSQKYDFALFDVNNKEIFRWSSDKDFLTVLSQTVIKAGDTVESKEELSLAEYGDIIDKAAYMKAYITGRTEDFDIDRNGYKKDIENKEIKNNVKVDTDAKMTNDGLVLKLKITNRGSKDVVIEHTAANKYDFVLFDEAGNEIYRWSDGKVFLMILTQTTIKPGESVEYSETLSFSEYGEIIKKAAYMKAYITGTTEDFVIDRNGYEVKLK